MAILTLAREYGSGGKDIGRTLSDAMGYRYVDRKQILEEMGKEGAKWQERATYFDENQPTAWEMYKWAFRGYVALTQYHILRFALEDNVVIVGRGGNNLIRGVPYSLRIRTVAPKEYRVKQVMEWEETNSENARHLIEKVDKEMAGAVYLIYGRTWDDLKQYDMVFDMSTRDHGEIVAIVKEELKRRDTLKTPDAVQILEMKLLAARIKAAVATEPTLFISSLDVRFKEEGLVKYGLVVSGAVHENDDKARIEEMVRELAGDVPVEINVQFRWHSRIGPFKF